MRRRRNSLFGDVCVIVVGLLICAAIITLSVMYAGQITAWWEAVFAKLFPAQEVIG